MARVMLSLGFPGAYHVHDLPEFGLLQRWYLRSLDEESAARVSFGDRLDAVPSREEAGQSVFVATWSLSETPVAVREQWRPVLDRCSSFLMAYQETFEGIDNRAWFDAFAASRPDVRWTHHEIPHIPGNYYLLGTRA